MPQGLPPPTTPLGVVVAEIPFAQQPLLDILDTVRDPLLGFDADFGATGLSS